MTYNANSTLILRTFSEGEAKLSEEVKHGCAKARHDGRRTAFEYAAMLMEQAEAEIARLKRENEGLRANLHHARQALDDAWGDAYRDDVTDDEWEEIIDGTSIVPTWRYESASS